MLVMIKKATVSLSEANIFRNTGLLRGEQIAEVRQFELRPDMALVIVKKIDPDDQEPEYERVLALHTDGERISRGNFDSLSDPVYGQRITIDSFHIEENTLTVSLSISMHFGKPVTMTRSVCFSALEPAQKAA